VIYEHKHVGRRALVRWVDAVRRWAWPIIALAAISSVGAFYYSITNFSINVDTTDMLSEELDFRQNDRALDSAFPQLVDNLSIVVEAGSGDQAEDVAEALAAGLAKMPERFTTVFYPEGEAFFRRNGFLYADLGDLETLSDRLAEAQPLIAALSADPSLRGLTGVLKLAIENATGEMAVALAPALAKMAETVEQVADGRPARLSWRSLISETEDDDPESRRKFITLKPVLDFTSLQPAADAVRAINKVAADLGLTEDNGVRLRIIGSPIMQQEEFESVSQGMGLVGLLSFVFVTLLLTLGLRSPRLILAAVATLVAGLIWTAYFAIVAIGVLNVISIAFAVLFIGLSVDFGIHFTLRYKEAIDQGSDHAAALSEAAGGVGGALTLSAVAAAIGFFSFLPTDYRGVSELGLISGVGMFIALFANLTLLPALMTVMPMRSRKSEKKSAAGSWLQKQIESKARVIVWGALALGVFAMASLPFARFDDDPLNLRDPDSESVATLLALLDDPRVEPYDASVLADDLPSAAALAERFAALPEVESATTLLDLVPEDQDDKLAIIDDIALFLTPVLAPEEVAPPPDDAELQTALKDLSALLEQAEGPLQSNARRFASALARLDNNSDSVLVLQEALLGNLPKLLDRLAEGLEAEPVGLDDLPAELRNRRVAGDGRATVEIIPSEDLRDPEARSRFVEAIRAIVPEATGAPIMITEGGRAVRKAFGEAGLYALVLIVLLLFLMLRSLKDTAMILAPLALAAVLTVGATVVLGQPFNFANVIVLPLLLGLGVSFGIQIVLRSRTEAIGRLMQTSTPRAVVFSALTTIGSFCALALSSHPGTASMGLLLTVAISLTMLCTLIVLPALLSLVARGRPAS